MNENLLALLKIPHFPLLCYQLKSFKLTLLRLFCTPGVSWDIISENLFQNLGDGVDIEGCEVYQFDKKLKCHGAVLFSSPINLV